MNVEKILLNPEFIKPLTTMGLRGASLVIKFGMTLYIAKFLGLEVLGIYGLIAAASIIAPPILGFAIMYIQSRKAITQDILTVTRALKTYISLISIIYLFIYFSSVVYAIFYGQFILVSLIILLIYFEHINQEVYGLLLNLAKPLSSNFLHFIRSAAWMLFYMPIAYYLPEYRNIIDLLIFWVFGSVISCILFLYFSRSWPWKKAKIETPIFQWARNQFKYSRTIYANNLANTTNQYYNHFLIGFFLGLELTGVFVFFSQAISAMSNLLLTGVIQFAKPKMVSTYKNSQLESYKNIFKSCLKNTRLTALLMMFIAVIVIQVLVFYVVDRPLTIHWLPAFYLMLVHFLLSNIKEAYNLFFYSQDRDDLILKYSIYAIIINFCLAPLALYFLSLWGAVIVNVISSAVILFFYKKKINGMIKTLEV